MKNFAIFFILLAFFCNNAQNLEERNEYKNTVDQFLTYSYSGNYEGLSSLLYPPIFERFTESEIQKKMMKFYEGNESFELDYGVEIPLYNLSPIYERDSTQFGFATFDIHKSMTYSIALDSLSQQAVIKNMERLGNEAYFINDSRVNIIRRNSMIVLIKNHKSHNKWCVLNFDENDPYNYNILTTFMMSKMREYALTLK